MRMSDWYLTSAENTKFVFLSVTEANFWLSFWLTLQPTASRQATTCLQSLHFTCVLGLLLIDTTPQTSRQPMRRANATRIRGSPVITEQTNTRASISRVAFGVNRPLYLLRLLLLEVHADCSWSQRLPCCKLLCLGLPYITIVQYKRSVVSCHALFEE